MVREVAKGEAKVTDDEAFDDDDDDEAFDSLLDAEEEVTEQVALS